MQHPAYEQMVQYASEGQLEDELAQARQEYVSRTGDMFASDDSYERRIAAFLEWYVLDRPVSFATHMTPAKMYIDSVADSLTTPEVNDLRRLTKTVLSLFEFKRARPETLRVVNLLTGEKLDVTERRQPAGLQPGDILEARLVPFTNDQVMFSDTVGFHPREARKAILRVAKAHRKNGNGRGDGAVDLVHRVAYFSNRCERYKHVAPKEIFAEL